MLEKQVVKRDGKTEKFDLGKLRKVMERATKGFDLDLKPLEEKMADFVKDQTQTSEIAKYLTMSALSLTTVNDPDWKNAAGRLKLFELYKQMFETRQTAKDYDKLYDYPKFLKFAEESGIYSKRISEVYSEEEIKLAAGFIEPKFDLVYDYVHDINSFRKSTFVDTCYPNMKITETDDEIRIESGKGFRCLNPDNGLITDHVDIAIVSELEVLENNADEVNDNTYSWTVNESNVQDKEVNLVLKRNKKNSMDINYFLIFGIIGVLIVMLGIGLFLISKNRQNNDI